MASTWRTTSTTTSSPRCDAPILDHQVVFFRGQRLTPEQQVAFSRRFGPFSPVPFIEPTADHPEVIAVVREASERQRYTFGSLWHSDFSFLPEPPFASILHALEVPPYGGDTIWANQQLAYESLSDGMRGMLAGLHGVHSAVKRLLDQDAGAPRHVHRDDGAHERRRRARRAPPRRPPAPGDGAPVAVRERAVHGRARRVRASPSRSRSSTSCSSTAYNPRFTCRWRWEVGDVAMWDNRCVQHMAMADFTGHRRFMHRTTVAGDRPIPAT